MTYNELKDFFITLVDDEDLSDTTLELLFNTAKNKLEMEAKPVWLVAKDTSKTGSSGDTYLTTKALPSDFVFMRKLYYGTKELRPISFEQSIRYKDSSNLYYIDRGNSVFAQTGNIGASDTYTLFYQKKSTDFDSSSGDTEVLTWETVHHPLVAYESAKIYQANMDADDLAFRMSAQQEKEYAILRDSFMAYCTDLALTDQNNMMDYEDPDVPFDLGLM